MCSVLQRVLSNAGEWAGSRRAWLHWKEVTSGYARSYSYTSQFLVIFLQRTKLDRAEVWQADVPLLSQVEALGQGNGHELNPLGFAAQITYEYI